MTRLLAFAFACILSLAAFGQAPSLPEDTAVDPRMSWLPTLQPTATVVAEPGKVTVWRTGSPVVVPLNGRTPLAVAVDQLANNAGEWIGVLGTHAYKLDLGDKSGANKNARAQGYSGISLVGLDTDPSSSSCASLRGLGLMQKVGVQRDIALINLTIDVWDSRPVMVAAKQYPDFGNLYVEGVNVLGIPNDCKTSAKGAAAMTWAFRLHGATRFHFLDCSLVDGVTFGDGLGGASEHFLYANAVMGDSEVVDTVVHGAQLSAVYTASRFSDRVKIPGGYFEAYSRGRLLVENLVCRDVGVGGTWAVNVTGGVQDVIVKNMDWRANLDGYPYAGTGGKWAGSAIQVYLDHKAWELDPLVPMDQGEAVGLGYSLEPALSGGLPMSPGVEALGLPWDGFGGARSLTIIGGRFECAGGKAPLINVRDCAQVLIVERTDFVTPFTASGSTVLQLARSGLTSSCGRAGDGLVPASLGAAWWQQCRFGSRSKPSSWINSVKVGPNGVALSLAEIDSWAGAFWEN